MPAEQRISPNAWDNAVTTIRGRHYEELAAAREEAVKAKITNDYLLNPPPVPPGSRGSMGGSDSPLSGTDETIARTLGVEVAHFKAVKKITDAYLDNPDPTQGCPLELTTPAKVQPGRF